jgi:H+/Cl- antiporter ClcA
VDLSLRFYLRCAVLALALSAAAGAGCAAFAKALDYATILRFAHPALLFGAPVVSVLTTAWYRRLDDQSSRGNDLILERINRSNGEVPPRMAPLIFCTSAAAHLCGASVGREGAAVQIGGGLAGFAQKLLRLPDSYQAPLLLSGMAAGFGAIFGTPFAAAVFAIECPGSVRKHLALFPLCILSGYTGDALCRAWGIHHAVYSVACPSWSDALQPVLWAALIAMSLGCGLLAKAYLRLGEMFRVAFRCTKIWWMPPLMAGCVLCGIAQFPASQDYLGLGVWSANPDGVTVASAFHSGGAHPWSWLLKLVLTAFCLSGGFKGGEVTPLFFVGATFGNVFSEALNLEPSLFAAFGFVAVFSAASHTPVAGICLASEMFGIQSFPWFIPVCLIAKFGCGRETLFPSQKKPPKSEP